MGGRRLAASQRQKLDVARGLLKRSDFFIVNRPLLALDYRLQEQILCNVLDEVRRDGRSPAVIWVVGSAAMAKYFDRVIVFDGGQLVEEGTHETLKTGRGIFEKMLA